MPLRLPLLIIVAVVLNLMLFYMIHQMVTSDQTGLAIYEELHFVDFVRLQREEPEPEPPPDEPPEELPPEEREEPPPEVPAPDVPQPEQMQFDMPTPDIDIPLGIDGTPYLGDFMRTPPPAPRPAPTTPEIALDVEPTVRIQPQYPPRALRAGIEGSVTVEFTIDTDGSVKDPTIVEADPPRVFDDAVLRAIRRWKFEPEIVDGVAIEKRARQVIRFRLQR